MSDTYHHGAGCETCHSFHVPTTNLFAVREVIQTPSSGPRAVVFTAESGPSSFAGGGQLNGICEVCHTTTAFYRGDKGLTAAHFEATDCMRCHPHDGEFKAAVGRGHLVHTVPNPRGPLLDCAGCHQPGGQVFNDGQTFAKTAVCDDCHSPDGAVDGVDDPDIGARPNWPEGVYVGDSLAVAKARWCAGCHDTGTSVVNGVSAPAVVQGVAFGFYTSGHGRADLVTCTDCHDPARGHVDATSHSYVAASDNYQDAFRLSDVDGGPPLIVPRTGWDWDEAYSDPPYYALCFKCHDKYALLGGPDAPPGPYYAEAFQTNFRNDPVVVIDDGLGTDIADQSVGGAEAHNAHPTHLAGPPHFYDTDGDGEQDSFGTCVSCHDVHGSTAPSMLRDGRLRGNPVGLGFAYLRYDRHDPPRPGCPDPIIMTSDDVTLESSIGAVMRTGSGPVNNGLCSFCHCSGLSSSGMATGDPEFVVNCYGPDCVDYYRQPVLAPTPLAP